MKTFKSPQTDSEYTVIAELAEATVAYRHLFDNGKEVRVRFQSSDHESLAGLLSTLQDKGLPFDWGATLRGNERVRHISAVVQKDEMPRMVGHLVANWLRIGPTAGELGAYEPEPEPVFGGFTWAKKEDEDF